MFLVTKTQPLQGTRLVAVCVVKYSVVVGLRLHGINVFSVVVQVVDTTAASALEDGSQSSVFYVLDD